MERESSVLHKCMLALSGAGCMVFRSNVGLFYTRDGRPVQTGLPKGFADLFGFAPNGRAFFVECKSQSGRLRPEQEKFLSAMRGRGAVAIVARDADECAREVLRLSQQ